MEEILKSLIESRKYMQDMGLNYDNTNLYNRIDECIRILENSNQSIFDEIFQERHRQNLKWGEQNHKPIEWIAILTEEVGEAAKEALDHHFKAPLKDGHSAIDSDQDMRMKNYREELIQVAAVAVQMIECLDRNSK